MITIDRTVKTHVLMKHEGCMKSCNESQEESSRCAKACSTRVDNLVGERTAFRTDERGQDEACVDSHGGTSSKF
jgi:hypothetical protein